MSSLFQEFHHTKWKKLSIDQRFEAIQKLEEYYAKQQGRDACPVVVTDDEQSLGFYYQNKIHINKTQLLQDDTAYEAVNTLLHEGRHAYQEYAIKHSLSDISQEELNKWKIDFSSGYLDKEPEYWFQAIEKDAKDYAFAETDKIFTKLEKELGENPKYKEYKEDWKRHFKKHINDLKLQYDDDYQQVIDDKVNKKFNLTQLLARDKDFNRYWLLNEDIESFIHQTYQKEHEPTVIEFKSYLAHQIKDRGYNKLSDYLNDLEKNKMVQNRSFGQVLLKDQPTISINTLNKMEQAHTLLTQQWKDTKPSNQNPNLTRNIEIFTTAVQKEFQKQYPDLKLKPFYLSTSKTAIDIMKHNSEKGKIVSPDRLKEDGFKDINKIVNQDRKYELER